VQKESRWQQKESRRQQKESRRKAALISRPVVRSDRVGIETIPLQAPFSHFFMKLVFAAPESGLPSALTALVAQESAMHFFMNEFLAAPASGLPSLPTALLSQVSCAKAAPLANVATNAANINFLSMPLSLEIV
jgi:hypothetical protein